MRFLPLYISLLLLTACYQTESTLTDSLIYCADKSPTSLNPQISHDIASLDATTHQLYNRLVKIELISKRFVADIATHWVINEDKTRYTFFLRKDINFHHTDYFTPSRPLNADDVIFSFKRMLSKKHPFHFVNGEADNYRYNHPFSSLVQDIIKIDDHTITFLLNKPDATLLANLAAHYGVIHSQEYALQLLKTGHPEKIDYFPIGTGPYQFKQKNKQIIRYQAHKFPWQAPVTINNLIFDITPNSTKRYAKLLSGECDIITNPASSQIKQISKNKSVLLSSQPTGNISLLSFNTKSSPFDKKEVRHALSEAINLDTILDAVFFETAVATNNLLPKHSWAYNPRTKKTTFSPQQSMTKLKVINFDFNKNIRIIAPIKNSIFNPNFYKTAELIQSNWADIGIKSEIILLRESELHNTLLTGDYDIYLTGSSPYIKDPDNLFRPLLSCNANSFEGNSSQWCDETMQNLLDATLLETNFIQRVKNYYQLQEMIQAQRIYLPIAHLLRFDVFNKNISGLLVDPLTGIDFQAVRKVLPINKVKAH
ncbi:ABC transporter substrate-binding protein [Psychromonas hadalis]|uniref:ABC transporter substrate-binding protein n=1 Tax=Psychromonas hadalis TaxID=211669 RepID=UPI0003B33E47|nr:ABC transporter substrate-binding protein [Psychromonas hadalis]